ncbi:MAG: fibronectin type III domain-containing protein, partial [Nitrosotalea sp.]
MIKSYGITLTLLGVILLVTLIGVIGPTMNAANASTSSVNKIQSGLVSSDSFTTGNTSGWTFGGTATLYDYYENSQGLHFGVQSPSSGQWVNYYAAAPKANAHLFHAALTIPYASVADGVFNPGLYVEGSNYDGIVGCQAYADHTGYYWIVQYSTDAGSTWNTLYAPPRDSLSQTEDCTVMTNGSNYLDVYIGGKIVFSSTTMNLNMPTPLHAFIQADTSSSSMDYTTYSNYYSTTDENIKVTNNPSNAVTVKIVDTTGNVLATAPVNAGTATLNIGMYKFPLVCTINVYDSSNSVIASRSANIFGGDVFSVTSSSGTPTVPQPPTGLTATSISTSQINLSWTAPSNNGGSAITGYKIERSTDSGTTWSTVQSNTGSTSTTYSDTGLSSSTTYTYRISAINSVGTSVPSNTASATTGSTTTSSIVLNNVQTTSKTVSSSPYQITISNFNAATGTNRLLVVGISANNNNVASVTFGGVHLNKKISTFSNNDAEFWYLTNPSGTGNIVVTMAGATSAVVGAYSFSGVDQTTPIPTSTTNHNSATVASSPTISITTKNPNSLVLDLPSIYGGVTLGSPTCTQQWDTNIPSAITGASSSAAQATAGSVSCSWTASGSGDSWDDAAIEIKSSGTGTTSTAPGSPTGLTATAGNSQILLSWTAPSSDGGSAITGYRIYRGIVSGGEGTTSIATVSGSTLSYTDTGLTNGVTYFYKVTAVNSVGESVSSNEASATPVVTASAPGSPTGLTATAASTSQINLSWTAPSNNGGSTITGYKIERSSDGGTTWSTLVANSASTSTTYSDTGLSPSTTYTYRVSTINSVGT